MRLSCAKQGGCPHARKQTKFRSQPRPGRWREEGFKNGPVAIEYWKNFVRSWRHAMKSRDLARIRLPLVSALGLVIVLTASASLRAADPEWKVGLSTIKITPEKPVFLAGYA